MPQDILYGTTVHFWPGEWVGKDLAKAKHSGTINLLRQDIWIVTRTLCFVCLRAPSYYCFFLLLRLGDLSLSTFAACME